MQIDDAPVSLVGADILNLITTGMYHTPLAIFREYIQNSADAIESSQMTDKGRVEVSISPAQRNVKIRDNGPGLTHTQAIENLIPIARSRKQAGVDRGFRGIGRLSGLAFADRITFRTRTHKTQPVSEITWEGTTLREGALASADPEQIIKNCVEVTTKEGDTWPNNFFEVEIENVSRHAADRILNRSAVRRYVSEVGASSHVRRVPVHKSNRRVAYRQTQNANAGSDSGRRGQTNTTYAWVRFEILGGTHWFIYGTPTVADPLQSIAIKMLQSDG